MNTTELDADELRLAVELVEANGPLETFKDLCQSVATVLGEVVSYSSVDYYISRYDIETKTPYAWAVHKPRSKIQTHRKVYTPSGKCPYVLKETSYDSVLNWMELVREHGWKEHLNYEKDAYKYYASHFYTHIYHPTELKLINEFIESIWTCERFSSKK